MMSGRTRRGSKPLTARDWLFGSRPRRLAVRFVLQTAAPDAGWTKAEIAAACGVSKHGGIDEHVDGLLALGLLDRRGRRYVPGNPAATLHVRLLGLIDELERVPEQRIDELLTDRSD